MILETPLTIKSTIDILCCSLTFTIILYNSEINLKINFNYIFNYM